MAGGGRTRRRIGSGGPHCNGPNGALRARRRLSVGLLLLSPLALLAGGCTEEPAPMETTADATAVQSADAEVDAAVILPVPVAPLELFRRMPTPPQPIAAVPGDLASGLTRARPTLRPSTYTDKVLVDRPTDSPFGMVHYQLARDGRTVEAVLATLVEGYAAEDRRAALEEAITLRLGAGEPLKSKSHSGMVWTTLPFRIELRTDKATGDLELLYHRRGRVDPVDKPPPPF